MTILSDHKIILTIYPYNFFLTSREKNIPIVAPIFGRLARIHLSLLPFPSALKHYLKKKMCAFILPPLPLKSLCELRKSWFLPLRPSPPPPPIRSHQPQMWELIGSSSAHILHLNKGMGSVVSIWSKPVQSGDFFSRNIGMGFPLALKAH